MLMRVVREMFEALAEDPWIIKENRDIEEAGFVDESALEIWINPELGHPTKTLIHEVIHIVEPSFDEDLVEDFTQRIWASTSTTMKDLFQDWYMFLCIESKKEADNYSFISDLEMHDYIRTQRGR